MASIKNEDMLGILNYAYRAPMVYDIGQFVQSGYTYKDYRSLCKFLQELTQQYPDIAFCLVYSSTESDENCKRVLVHSDKPGRPKHEILGTKILPHIHGLTLGLSKNSYFFRFDAEVKDHLRELHKKSNSIKRYSAKPFDDTKPPSIHAGNYFRYEYKQADHECYGGAEHNWKYYLSPYWHN